MDSSLNKIIFTDLDGTITNNDTFFLSIFTFGSKSRIGILFFIFPFLFLGHILKIFSRNMMKKMVFFIVFKNASLSKMDQKKDIFLSKIKINDKVMERISSLKNKEYKVVLVTASLDFYIQFIIQKFNFDDYICTLTDKKINKLSGKLLGNNCNYYNKVERIDDYLNYKRDSYFIISFGNSKGDYEMLKYADEFYFVNKTGEISVKNPVLN